MALSSAFAQERSATAPTAAGVVPATPPAGSAADPGWVTGVPAGVSSRTAPSATSSAAQPPTDATGLGKALLNAGPDPRVNLNGLSPDHAAIFGTDDPDEQSLLDQERALQSQRDQLKVLERMLNAPPPTMDPHPPAMIPLHPGAPTNMQPLAPTPSESELDRGNSASRRSIDEMQRRVNTLRRDADTLKQGGR